MTDKNIILPTLERLLYDERFGTDTRFGLGAEQIFVDPDVATATVTAILTDPSREFSGVDIDDFINNQLNFSTPEDIIATMEAIYENFATVDVNYIFFQILNDAFVDKSEFEEFFKTSWVALQITQNVVNPLPVDPVALNLQGGGGCFIGEVALTPTVTPSFTPSPTPQVSPSLTPTPSVTGSPTPSPTITPTNTVTSSVTPTITPTISFTPTPSVTNNPTPTPSPTATSAVTVTPTMTPTITPNVTPTMTPSATVTITPTPSTSITPSITATVTPTISITPSTTAIPVTPPSTPIVPALVGPIAFFLKDFTGIDPVKSFVSISLGRNGGWWTYTREYLPAATPQHTHDWFLPNLLDIGADYEAMLTFGSGGGATALTSGTLGVWFSLVSGGGASWTWQDAAYDGNISSWFGTLTIRKVANPAEIVSHSIQISTRSDTA